MKTLMFVLYFVAMLSLIEAGNGDWSVRTYRGFRNFDRYKIVLYTRSAMRKRGWSIGNKMEFLEGKIKNDHGGYWNCVHTVGPTPRFWGSGRYISLLEMSFRGTQYYQYILCKPR